MPKLRNSKGSGIALPYHHRHPEHDTIPTKNHSLSRKADANKNYGQDGTVDPNSNIISRMDNQRFNPPPAFFHIPSRTHEIFYVHNGLYYNTHYPDFPWQILTLVRFIQLLEINASMHTLSQSEILFPYLKLTDIQYILVILAVVLHLLFWLFEENVIRRMKKGRDRVLLCGMTTVSFAYTLCGSYIAMFLYVNMNYFHCVTYGATFISILYFSYHLHWVSKSTRVTWAVEHFKGRRATVHFDNATRPETSDIRLNVGPQLVFPIPEEYSVPGC